MHKYTQTLYLCIVHICMYYFRLFKQMIGYKEKKNIATIWSFNDLRNSESCAITSVATTTAANAFDSKVHSTICMYLCMCMRLRV